MPSAPLLPQWAATSARASCSPGQRQPKSSPPSCRALRRWPRADPLAELVRARPVDSGAPSPRTYAKMGAVTDRADGADDASRDADDASRDALHAALAAAVAAVGGVDRPGQIAMAEAVLDAVDSGEHLLVQAGTGTGKSLAYLVPALLHDKPVVVATATIALQRQLVERDLPRLAQALEPLGHKPAYAILKGRQ